MTRPSATSTRDLTAALCVFAGLACVDAAAWTQGLLWGLITTGVELITVGVLIGRGDS